MRRKSRPGANLFFIEFIIVLFFFLIISTICIRIFVHSYQVTQHAEALSHAQSLASGIAELLEGSDNPSSDLPVVFPDLQETPEGFTLTYNRQFEICPAEEAYYTLFLTLALENHEKKADISYTDCKGSVIYTLSVTFHQGLTRKEVLS